MTDKSNEKIVVDAMAEAGAPLMHSRVEEAVVAALDAAGRLVGEPTVIEKYEYSAWHATQAQMPTEPGVYYCVDPNQKHMGEYHTDGHEFHYLNTNKLWVDIGFGTPCAAQAPFTRLAEL